MLCVEAKCAPRKKRILRVDYTGPIRRSAIRYAPFKPNIIPLNLLRTISCLIVILANEADAQQLSFPENAKSHWIVDNPEEVVSWTLFYPEHVADHLPSFLRFISVEELAANGIPWAEAHLDAFSTHSQWGVSFLEIVRMERFDIDGREPSWPEDGAVGLWLARVASSDSNYELSSGTHYLILNFWLPDGDYAQFMRQNGFFAEYGDVRLRSTQEGKWIGSVELDDIRIDAECTPAPSRVGPGSIGVQHFYPPVTSGVRANTQVQFAGHRIHDCLETTVWKIQGSHPLSQSVFVGRSTYQYGYDFKGGSIH